MIWAALAIIIFGGSGAENALLKIFHHAKAHFREVAPDAPESCEQNLDLLIEQLKGADKANQADAETFDKAFFSRAVTDEQLRATSGRLNESRLQRRAAMLDARDELRACLTAEQWAALMTEPEKK